MNQQDIVIPVVTRLQDNQDGGYTMYVYNNEDEMIADHPESVDGEMSDELRAAILNGDDEYENGYVEKDKISIEVTREGEIVSLKLAKPLSFHAGQ
jgi:hypothetical protein